jgi:methionine-rich copper-binding protein CopC
MGRISPGTLQLRVMSRKPFPGLAALMGLVMAGCAPSLVATPHLVAASPGAGARLPVERQTFELSFNRRLSTDATWIVVWRDDDGAPMPIDTTIDPNTPGRVTVRLREAAPGAYRLHWHAVSARTLSATDGEQAFSLQDESVAPPRLELSRTTADTGERLDIVGKGFGQKCVVTLTVGDDQQPLATIETDAHGAFQTEAPIPAAVPFGLQPLFAEDPLGGKATSAVQLKWGGWPPLTSFTIGQPGPRPGEVTFALNVRNRSDYVLEHVRVVLSDPPGATFVSAGPTAERQGGATVWIVPTLDRGLVGPFRATYRAPSPVVGHTWVEFRHRHSLGCTEDDCSPAFISESVSESEPVAPAAASGTRGASPGSDDTRQRRL